MTTIHFVRHGETEWNLQERLQGHQDSPLTERGVHQATWLAERLQDYSFDIALCSSSGRTRQTAELIVQGRDIPLQPRDELRELKLGEWEGKTKQQITGTDPENFWCFWNRPDQYRTAPNGETFEAFIQRVRQTFDTIAREYRDQEVLVVTHMVFIKTLLAQLDERPLSELWAPPQLENCAHRIIRPLASGGYRVTSTGDTSASLSVQSC